MQGLMIRGVCKGFAKRQRGNFEATVLGLCFEVSDGFGGLAEQVVEVDIPQTFATAEGLARVSALRGSVVEVPVYIRAYSGKNGPGFNYALPGDAQLQPLTPRSVPDQQKKAQG